MNKSVLVIFGKDLPKKSKKWWQQFDKVLGSREIEELTDPGSVQEAYDLVNKISRMTLADGSRLSKLINYQGYELWWIDYDSIYEQFCLPYTQYRRLLEYLNDFDKIYLYQPPYADLFLYFLRAYNRQCTELKSFSAKLRKWLLPGGIFVQLVLSAMFLAPLIISRPKIMFLTNDYFNPPYHYDFRHKHIYQELEKNKIHFVQFIKSLQPWPTVLKHAWQRKRPVIYSEVIIYFIFEKLRLFEKKEDKNLIDSLRSSGVNPKERFWLAVSTHYLKDNIRVTRWSFNVMRCLLRLIGVRSAIFGSAGNKTFHEVLGCKLAGIPTVGIQHGATPRYFFVSDFMPEFDGEKSLSVDKYGVWSEWWREYYIKNSRAYQKDQLYISGSPRPLEKGTIPNELPVSKNAHLSVLFVSQQLDEPKEVMPYLLTLLNEKDFTVFLKFRPQVDRFEEWLKKNEPSLLERVKILKGNIHEATLKSQVVVGSCSTAVLEGLVQLRPVVFFRTQKWGDYFNIKDFGGRGCFFAENPKELLSLIKKSPATSREELIKLRERFFGNPYQNGAKWLVEQAIKEAKLF